MLILLPVTHLQISQNKLGLNVLQLHNWVQIAHYILAECPISLIFGKAMGSQLLIIVTLTDNLVIFATLAESFFSINYCLENMKETQ